jgi:hypothetical protein
VYHTAWTSKRFTLRIQFETKQANCLIREKKEQKVMIMMMKEKKRIRMGKASTASRILFGKFLGNIRSIHRRPEMGG